MRPAIGVSRLARLRRFGPNQVSARKRLSEWMRFLLQFHQPLIYILLASAGIAAGLGKWVDASVIFGVVALNAIIGYIQEAKAENAINAPAKMVVTEATVRRGGEKLRVPSAHLVPGDVVLLQSGDSVLAAETLPVNKKPMSTLVPAGGSILADMALKQLQDGNDRFVVGTSTQTSKDAKRRAQVAEGQTPFAIIVSCSACQPRARFVTTVTPPLDLTALSPNSSHAILRRPFDAATLLETVRQASSGCAPARGMGEADPALSHSKSHQLREP